MLSTTLMPCYDWTGIGLARCSGRESHVAPPNSLCLCRCLLSLFSSKLFCPKHIYIFLQRVVFAHTTSSSLASFALTILSVPFQCFTIFPLFRSALLSVRMSLRVWVYPFIPVPMHVYTCMHTHACIYIQSFESVCEFCQLRDTHTHIHTHTPTPHYL